MLDYVEFKTASIKSRRMLDSQSGELNKGAQNEKRDSQIRVDTVISRKISRSQILKT